MKVFVLILALLLVLFAVGVGLGIRDDGGRRADPADFGWLDSLTRPFRPPVETGALQGPCLSGRLAVIGPSEACVIAVAPAEESVRTLKLLLAAGPEVEAGFEPGGGGSLPVRSSLRAGREEVTLSVPAEGGSLALACGSVSAGCQVRLE